MIVAGRLTLRAEHHQIRVALDEDIPEMHRLRMSVRENRLLDPNAVGPNDYRLLLESQGKGWVALQGRVLTGFAVGDLARARVWALFVDPHHEGLGVGRALHDTMMAWMFDSGLHEVRLSTDPGTRAERFYLAAGWRPAGTDRGEQVFTLQRRTWVRRASACRPLSP